MFTLTEHGEGKYMISLKNYEGFSLPRGGSFNILPARLLNLTYPDYLRLCRGQFSAELCGREGYSYPRFSKENGDRLVKILNKVANSIPKGTWEQFCSKREYEDKRYKLPNGIEILVRRGIE